VIRPALCPERKLPSPTCQVIDLAEFDAAKAAGWCGGGIGHGKDFNRICVVYDDLIGALARVVTLGAYRVLLAIDVNGISSWRGKMQGIAAAERIRIDAGVSSDQSPGNQESVWLAGFEQ